MVVIIISIILVNKNYYNEQRDLYKYYSIHDYSHTACNYCLFIQYYRNLLVVSQLFCLSSKYAFFKCSIVDFLKWLLAVNLKSNKIIDDLGTTSFQSTFLLQFFGSRYFATFQALLYFPSSHTISTSSCLIPSTLAISGSSSQFSH